jgi:hypothetical protein
LLEKPQQTPGARMTANRNVPRDQPKTRAVKTIDNPFRGSKRVTFTRDHDVIREWAAERRAEPATGEATSSGPATSHVNDGGAGIRFNFPGLGAFRPIEWDEWFENFDRHECAFVYDAESTRPPNMRYRIVKAEEWKDLLQ